MAFDIEWKNFYTKNDGNSYPDPAVVRFIARNFYDEQVRSNINIMEIGCGGGGTLWYLAREGFNVYGIDASSEAICKTEKKLNNEKLKANLTVGDFKKLPYEDNSFNAVLDVTSVQHNDNKSIEEILAEVYRALKPGGKYFGMMIESNKELSSKDFYTNYLTREEIEILFHKFSNLEVNTSQYTEEDGKKYIQFSIITANKE
jgi:ubiquinone/menaquinone biosynthesis C-methylase UbiE